MKTKKQILLVEDDPKDAELTLGAFREENLADNVVHARDGAEALDFLHGRGRFASMDRSRPVVVLLDLKMPKVDGFQVLGQIKSDAALRTIPIVMLTSSREKADLDRCYSLGANAYVVKPVHFKDFQSTVKGICVFWGLVNEPPPAAASA